VDSPFGESELIGGHEVLDAIELGVDCETCCDAGVEASHADGTSGTVGFGWGNEKGGAQEASAFLWDATAEDGIDEILVGRKKGVFQVNIE